MDNIGLLLRFSIAATFLVGGFSAGYSHIKSSVDWPMLLIFTGMLLASGHAMCIAAALGIMIIAYYCVGKIDFDKSLLDNANAIKREFAFLATGAILFIWQGGRGFRAAQIFQSPAASLIGAKYLQHLTNDCCPALNPDTRRPASVTGAFDPAARLFVEEMPPRYRRHDFAGLAPDGTLAFLIKVRSSASLFAPYSLPTSVFPL